MLLRGEDYAVWSTHESVYFGPDVGICIHQGDAEMVFALEVSSPCENAV